MTFSRLRLWLIAAVATVVLGGAVPHSAGASQTAGYVLFNALSESFEASGNVITLSGTITNYCTNSLPAGSTLVFEFDNSIFAGFTITALNYGDQQQFSTYGSLSPKIPVPKNNKTSLDFTIFLPKSLGLMPIGTQKTSPCLVTLEPGIPPI